MINISSIPEMKNAVEFTKAGKYALAVEEISSQFEKRIEDNFSGLLRRRLYEKSGNYFFHLVEKFSYMNNKDLVKNEYCIKTCVYQAKKHYTLADTPSSRVMIANLDRIFNLF